MNEPKRLTELSGHDFERDLILTARGDTPSPASMRRTLTGLGVGLSLPFGAAAAQGAVVPAKVGAAVLAKWLVTGVALGVATAGGAHVTERALRHDSRRIPSVAVAPVERQGVAAVGKPAMASPAESVVVQQEPPPSSAAPARLEPPRGAAPPEPLAPSVASADDRAPLPVAADSLELEVSAVDAARRALARGAAPEAVARLEAYQRDFGNGALLPEARVLEVRALLAAGERARAAALAESIIADNPSGSHAEVVRRLISHNP